MYRLVYIIIAFGLTACQTPGIPSPPGGGASIPGLPSPPSVPGGVGRLPLSHHRQARNRPLVRQAHQKMGIPTARQYRMNGKMTVPVQKGRRLIVVIRYSKNPMGQRMTTLPITMRCHLKSRNSKMMVA